MHILGSLPPPHSHTHSKSTIQGNKGQLSVVLLKEPGFKPTTLQFLESELTSSPELLGVMFGVEGGEEMRG